MSAHSKASPESQALCDRLLQALQQDAPDLERSSTQVSCGFFRSGWTRFAYVYHSKTKPQVEVWCRGDVPELERSAGSLRVRPRDKIRPGWEEAFPARFTLDRTTEVQPAAKLLSTVSMRASSPK